MKFWKGMTKKLVPVLTDKILVGDVATDDPQYMERSDFIKGIVLYDVQALTDPQKLQARTNINAETAGTASSLVSTEITNRNNAITNAINALKDGVGGAYDTLKKIQTEHELDDSQFSALVNAISNKVDKVEGKGLSECDYTSEDRSKVIGYPTVSDDADTLLAANGNGGGASFKTPAQLGLVGTNVQALTNAQKLQARKNIGSEIAANLTTDTSGKVLDAFQGYILDQKIKLKADKITLVAFQLTAPNAALFNTGDIYYNTASKKLFVNVQNAQAEWEEVAIKVNTIYAFSTYNYVANGGKLIKIEALSDINLNKLITYNQLDTTLEAGIYLLDDILSVQAAFTDLFCEDTYAGFVVHRTLRVEATTGAASMQYLTGNNGFEYSRMVSGNGAGDWTLGIAAWVDENFVRASEVADMGVRYFIDNNGISRAFGDYVDVNGNIIYAVFSNSADSADISSGINYRFAWLFDVYGYANNANNANNAINAYEANAALMYGNSWLFDSLFSSNGYANNANNASYAEGTTINGSTWTFDYLFNGSGYAKNAVEAQYAGGNFSTTYIPQIYSGLQDNWKIYLEDPLTSEMRKISKADFIAWLAQ